MPDEPTQDGQAEASAPAPATTPDIEKLKSEIRESLSQEFEVRVAGFQTALNEKEAEIRQLRAASLSDEEREQLAEQEKDQRIAELEAQVRLNELAQRYPQVADTYMALLNANDEEEQAELLLKLVSPPAPATESTEPPAPSDVDKNNPAPTVGEIVGRMPDGSPISGDAAWEALRRLGPAPTAGR